jgi:hypothetical protein
MRTVRNVTVAVDPELYLTAAPSVTSANPQATETQAAARPNCANNSFLFNQIGPSIPLFFTETPTLL